LEAAEEPRSLIDAARDVLQKRGPIAEGPDEDMEAAPELDGQGNQPNKLAPTA
jgi:hypothetical protein